LSFSRFFVFLPFHLFPFLPFIRTFAMKQSCYLASLALNVLCISVLRVAGLLLKPASILLPSCFF